MIIIIIFMIIIIILVIIIIKWTQQRTKQCYFALLQGFLWKLIFTRKVLK